MAVTITSVGSAHDFAVTSLPTGATVTVATGDWLVAVLATASNLTVSFSDPGGNSWTNRVSVMDAAGRAKIHFATAPITSAFSSGTVTASLSAASGQDALQVYRVRPGVGQTISFVAADTTGADGNLTLHAAATVSVANGNIIFGGAALETNDPVTGDSDTLNGSWSSIVSILEDGGTDLSAIVSSSQYKTVSATGNQSWSCTTTSARQGICSYLVLHVTGAAFSLAAAEGQYTLSGTAMTPKLGHAPLTAAAGSYALTGTAASLSKSGANKVLGTDVGSYSLTGTNALTTHGYISPAAAGSYALSGVDAAPTAGAATSYALTGTTAVVRMGFAAAAAAGAYTLLGSDAGLNKTTGATGKVIGADVGSYALTGSDAGLLHGWRVVAGEGTIGDLLLESGDNLLLEEVAGFLLEIGDNLVLESGNNLLLEDIPSDALDLEQAAGAGSFYDLSGTNQSLLHGWVVRAGFGDELEAEDGDPLDQETGGFLLEEVQAAYQLDGSDVLLLSTGDQFIVAEAGAYSLIGTAATLTLVPVSKVLVAEPGSYLLTGSDVTLTSSAQPAVSPLHIGEWPLDKRRRRRREDAVAAEQRARKRFRDAIGRLLEGLPPEFDEPEALDDALDNAVQAANLLYAMSAPIREINEVNALIDHIRQLRIAQPIAQLAMAQAYNQAHRHLAHKAQEDITMALLLGLD